MSEERKYFSGDTLEQAVLQAARHHGIEPEELAYTVLEKRHGFLKSRRRVVILVDAGAPRRAPAPEAPVGEASVSEALASEAPVSEAPVIGAEEMEPAPPAPEPAPEELEEEAGLGSWGVAEEDDEEMVPEFHPAASRRQERDAGKRVVKLGDGLPHARERFPRATGVFADAAREALGYVFEAGSLELEAEVLQGDDNLEIEIWGNDQDILLRDRGRLLLAIQHLLPRLIRGIAGDSVPCRVDSDNFHEIRAERLRDLAQRVASEVHQQGRPKTLEPMSPDERRIVHVTLADDPTVETESRGQGLFKRVTIRPIGRGRGLDRFRR